MTDTGGRVSAEHIHIAAGNGLLARRASALLFIPGSGSGVDALVAAFAALDAATVVDSVTDAATAAGFETAPFVLVDWADELHVVVLGPVEVRTDHPSLPMLSGAGSGSWVERRLRIGVVPITVQAGDAASPSTDLQLGRVSAAGFAATFDRVRTQPDPDPEPVPPPLPVSQPAAATPVVTPASTTVPTTAADPTGPIGTDRLAALRAAMRGPIEQEPTPSSAHVARSDEPSVASPSPPPAATTPTPPLSIDDEVTLAPDDAPVEPRAANDASNQPTHQSTDTAFDPDERAQPPIVPARRCGRGHLNPPHVGACRTCGDLLDARAPTEQVRQPPLATLDLDDDALPIDRPLVLGRKPNIGAAQATDRARLVVLAADASVSRTHVRIDVEDWTLTVTDCGSRSGTAIVARPGDEPRILEPWVAHELPIGARLFLGGPTSVVIRPAGAG